LFVFCLLFFIGAQMLPAQSPQVPPGKARLFLPKDQWPPGLLHASEREDVLEIFWEQSLYDLGKVWKTSGDMGDRFQVKKVWDSLNVSQTFRAQEGNTCLLERDYAQALDGYDGLIVRVGLSRGQKIRITAQMDGQVLPSVERVGADVEEEVFVPLSSTEDKPRMLTHLAFAFLPAEAGKDGQALARLSWILLHKVALSNQEPVRTVTPLPPMPASVGVPRYPREFAANLLMTPEEADAWRQAFFKSDEGKKIVQAIENRAKPYVDYDPTPFMGDYAPALDKLESRVGVVDQQWDHKLISLATAYLVTGNEAYGQASRRLLLAMVRTPYWTTSFTHRVLPGSRGGAPFPEGVYLTSAALAYDWCYSLLTEEERTEAAQGIFRSGVRQIGDWLSAAPDYWKKMNQGAVFNSPMILGALAIQDRMPEAKAYLNSGKANLLENLELSFDVDGAGYEGIGYWNLQMHSAVQALAALEHAEPGFLEKTQGHWRQSLTYALAMRSTIPQKSYVGQNIGDNRFGDGPGSDVLSFYAHYLHDVRARALCWQAYGSQKTPNDIWSTLWLDLETSSAPDIQEAKAPLASWFHGVGLVNFRSGLDANLVNFLFVSGPWGRNHGDKNSFVLEACGERLAVDPGMVFYNNPRHLLLPRTEFHNVVTINDREQDNPGATRQNAAEIKAFASGPRFALVSSDATAAYKSAQRYERSVLYLRPNLFFMVDDVAAPTESEITWRLATPLPIRMEEGMAILTGKKANLTIFPIAPGDIRFAQRPIFADQPDVRQLLISCHATATHLLHLLQVTPTGQPSLVMTPVHGENATAVSVPTEEGTVLFISAAAPGSWKVQDWEGDARCAALLVRNQKLVDAAWIDGTKITGKDIVLHLPTSSGTLPSAGHP